MALGNEIVVTANPKGNFRQVKIDGTPKPGTILTPKPGATIDANGIQEYEPAGVSTGLMTADGTRIPIAILLSDDYQGKTAADAYVDGNMATVYFPIAGDELNVLFLNETGTADDVVAGTTLLIVDDGTGKVIPTAGSPEAEPFLALESYTDPTADKLLHVLYTSY
jgi:hypothetical protein